jgi:hypothetical protein
VDAPPRTEARRGARRIGTRAPGPPEPGATRGTRAANPGPYPCTDGRRAGLAREDAGPGPDGRAELPAEAPATGPVRLA